MKEIRFEAVVVIGSQLEFESASRPLDRVSPGKTNVRWRDQVLLYAALDIKTREYTETCVGGTRRVR